MLPMPTLPTSGLAPLLDEPPRSSSTFSLWRISFHFILAVLLYANLILMQLKHAFIENIIDQLTDA
jgi:hypothetical protein